MYHKEIESIVELSRTNLEAAKNEVKKVKRITYGQAESLIHESLVPMSPERRSLIKSLILKVKAKDIAPKFKHLLKILVEHPRSFSIISDVLDRLRKISYDDVLSCFKASLEVKDPRLAYFCVNLTFKCPPAELSHNLEELLQLMDHNSKICEAVRAVLKMIPASYLPEVEKLDRLQRASRGKKSEEIAALLIKRKAVGDKKFIADGFAAAFEFKMGKTPSVKIRGENINVVFSKQLASHCNFSFRDIVASPGGPAIVACFIHDALVVVPIGEEEGFYIEGVPLSEMKKCGINKIGRHY